MSDVDVLRELTGRLLPPRFDELAAVARRRRRRATVGGVAAVAVLVAGLGLAADSLPGDSRSLEPVEAPKLIRTERLTSLEVAWTPKQIRFDDGSRVIQDTDDGRAVGYRLRRADGTKVRLRVMSDPAPAVAGPGVFVANTGGIFVSEDLYLVDGRAGTLRPLAVPRRVRYWGPNVDEFVWGVTDSCRVFWATGVGTIVDRRLDCHERLDFTGLDKDMFPAGWLRPGRMAMTESYDRFDRLAVHVSLDSGATWQRIVLDGVNVLDDDGAVVDALQRLG